MFGYISPDKPHLYLKDDVLYKALYCGICKSLKQKTGQISRFTLSYDMAFMSALAHNIMGIDVDIEKKRCIAHAIKKRPIAKPDKISLMLASLNVILTYYKLKDDVLDEKKGGIKSSIFYNAYKKAKREYPQIDLTVKTCYERLLKLERENTDSIDIVSDCFAEMLKEISVVLFEDKSTEYTQNLTYAIGKWIYLIDALDDYDKDIKKQNYNVFYNVYKSSDYLTLIKEHEKDIVFVFSTIFIQISENYSKIPMQYNTDLVVNILTRGIPTKTKQILNKGKENNGQVL
ncbi:MAG: hypothetical protein J6Q58_05120 [Clostridia bacterium]|nr:hypothetical protein [Clostridia bacterium]